MQFVGLLTAHGNWSYRATFNATRLGASLLRLGLSAGAACFYHHHCLDDDLPSALASHGIVRRTRHLVSWLGSLLLRGQISHDMNKRMLARPLTLSIIALSILSTSWSVEAQLSPPPPPPNDTARFLAGMPF